MSAHLHKVEGCIRLCTLTYKMLTHFICCQFCAYYLAILSTLIYVFQRQIEYVPTGV